MSTIDGGVGIMGKILVALFFGLLKKQLHLFVEVALIALRCGVAGVTMGGGLPGRVVSV
jgi:hypothetical protein